MSDNVMNYYDTHYSAGKRDRGNTLDMIWYRCVCSMFYVLSLVFLIIYFYFYVCDSIDIYPCFYNEFKITNKIWAEQGRCAVCCNVACVWIYVLNVG